MPALSVDRLHQLLLAPPRSDEADLLTLLQTCYEKRFTGAVTLHFKDGRPLILELPPVQIRVAQP